MATYDEIRIVLRTLAYDMDFRVPDGISKGITAMAALAELGASKTGFMSYYDLSEALDIPKPAVTKAGRVLHQARLAKSVNPGGIRGLSITCDGYVLLEMTNNRVRGVGRQAEPVERAASTIFLIIPINVVITIFTSCATTTTTTTSFLLPLPNDIHVHIHFSYLTTRLHCW